MREIWKKLIFCIGLKRDRVFLRFSVSHRVQITERVDSHIDDMQFFLVFHFSFSYAACLTKEVFAYLVYDAPMHMKKTKSYPSLCYAKSNLECR